MVKCQLAKLESGVRFSLPANARFCRSKPQKGPEKNTCPVVNAERSTTGVGSNHILNFWGKKFFNHMSQKRIIIIVLIVVVFSILGILGYFVLWDKIAIANWKMYRNEKYAFEIKYPPEVDFKECGSPVVGFDYDSNRICAVDGRFIIHVIPSSQLSLNSAVDFVNSQLNDLINTKSTIGRKQWDTFSGTIKEKQFGNFKAVHNFISLDENLYEISFIIESNKDPSYYARVFNRMISTFKFTR